MTFEQIIMLAAGAIAALVLGYAAASLVLHRAPPKRRPGNRDDFAASVDRFGYVQDRRNEGTF